MKLTITDERGLDGAARVGAKLDLESSFGIAGLGYGRTAAEAACDAIDKMADELEAMRANYAPAPAGPIARGKLAQHEVTEAVRTIVEIARKLAAAEMSMSVTLHGDQAIEALDELGATIKAEQSESSRYNTATLQLDTYGATTVRGLGDTRWKTAEERAAEAAAKAEAKADPDAFAKEVADGIATSPGATEASSVYDPDESPAF